MAKGLWAITFETPEGHTSGGVVIFDEAHLYGGDAGFYYFGTYTTNPKDGTLIGEVEVRRHDLSAVFILPAPHGGTLQMSGKLTQPVASLKAYLLQYPQQTLTIRCTYLRGIL
jgi:glyoxylase-like metal-dependent hydrolase (beta-lactamase superfamily II)